MINRLPQFIQFAFLAMFFAISQALAFSGGSMGSLGGGGGVGGSSSGNSQVKSGISIVDPQGKSYNCQPFVDKKWDSTDYVDNWNGVYFAIGGENSSFSGNFVVDGSSLLNPSMSQQKYTLVSNLNKNINLSGSSTSAVVNLGGGTLIDRVYLGSDIEIRTAKLSSTFNMEVDDYDNNGKKINSAPKSHKFDFTISNYVLFNAKIGYLITDRFMTYFNAGIGSFSSFDITSNQQDYKIDVDSSNIPPPIRLSIGGEYLLSNHFRFYADYSHWMIPKVYGQFRLSKPDPNSTTNSSSGPSSTSNSIVAKLQARSVKFGILYRF